MSAKHPVIAVTGSSGAGTTTTSLAFRKIFAQLNLHAAEVEGDSFHRYTRPKWTWRSAKRATPGGISATSAPKRTTSACWNKPSLNTVRAAKEISQISAYLRRSRTVESGTGDIHPMATFTGTH